MLIDCHSGESKVKFYIIHSWNRMFRQILVWTCLHSYSHSKISIQKERKGKIPMAKNNMAQWRKNTSSWRCRKSVDLWIPDRDTKILRQKSWVQNFRYIHI